MIVPQIVTHYITVPSGESMEICDVTTQRQHCWC